MRTTIIITALLTLSGCATMIGGDSEPILIESEPTGQPITVDGAEYTTPATVELSRKTDHQVTFADGQTVAVVGKFAPLTILNAGWGLVGIAVGTLVDAGSGAISGNLEPDHIVWRDGKLWNGEKGKEIGE